MTNLGVNIPDTVHFQGQSGVSRTVEQAGKVKSMTSKAYSFNCYAHCAKTHVQVLTQRKACTVIPMNHVDAKHITIQHTRIELTSKPSLAAY